MLYRQINFQKLELKQRMLRFLKISLIVHWYRFYIKSFFDSLIFIYSDKKDFMQRHSNYANTRKTYRRLSKTIYRVLKYKKIKKLWNEKNYNYLLKLILLYIFEGPLIFLNKVKTIYRWIKYKSTPLFKYLKKLYYFIYGSQK